MFNSINSRYTDEKIKKMKVSELKYNIARQELYLQFLKDLGILYNKKIYVNASTKSYKALIEESQIPALSICRLLKEASSSIVSYLVSSNYNTCNPFNIVGFNGHLLVYDNKTWLIGINDELNPYLKSKQEAKICYAYDHFNFMQQHTLIFIQGQSERAFNLVGSEYDTAFGDVYDSDDKETICFYNELYYYMLDYYSNGYTDVYNYETKQDGKVYRIIYCPKLWNRDKDDKKCILTRKS